MLWYHVNFLCLFLKIEIVDPFHWMYYQITKIQSLKYWYKEGCERKPPIYKRDKTAYFQKGQNRPLTIATKPSHVVGVLKVYYLLSYTDGWLGQYCCGVATANTYSLDSVPCLTVRTKGLREFKQGLLSYSGEWYERTLNYYWRYSKFPTCWVRLTARS